MNYAGFWRRLTAYFLDGILWLPVVFFVSWLMAQTRLAPAYWLLPGVLLGLWYHVHLVVKYGGTPGKLWMGVRIVKLDGSAAGYREAALRYAPLFVLLLLADVALTVAAFRTPDADYLAVEPNLRALKVSDFTPAWLGAVLTATALWNWSEFVVLLTNARRRALHDFLAGTVVVRFRLSPVARAKRAGWSTFGIGLLIMAIPLVAMFCSLLLFFLFALTAGGTFEGLLAACTSPAWLPLMPGGFVIALAGLYVGVRPAKLAVRLTGGDRAPESPPAPLPVPVAATIPAPAPSPKSPIPPVPDAAATAPPRRDHWPRWVYGLLLTFLFGSRLVSEYAIGESRLIFSALAAVIATLLFAFLFLYVPIKIVLRGRAPSVLATCTVGAIFLTLLVLLSRT